MPRAKCATCGATLPKNSKFCPECGAAVASGNTVVQDVPATETGPTPVEEHVSQRQLFGVPPSSVLLVLAIVGLIVAIVLFATGYWPWALIALGRRALSLHRLRVPGSPPSGRRRHAGSRLLSALMGVRTRAGAAKETIAAHGGARIELSKLRRDASGLAKQRSERARELGEAVYAKNTTATKELKQRMQEIDDELSAKEAQMAKVTIDAQERIGKARLQAQPTRVVAEERPDPAPEPVPVRSRSRAARRGPAAGAGAGPGALSAAGRRRPAAAAGDPRADPSAGFKVGNVRRTS
jgi:hypothetical protein